MTLKIIIYHSCFFFFLLLFFIFDTLRRTTAFSERHSVFLVVVMSKVTSEIKNSDNLLQGSLIGITRLAEQ